VEIPRIPTRLSDSILIVREWLGLYRWHTALAIEAKKNAVMNVDVMLEKA
jgi:hypothetical protein